MIKPQIHVSHIYNSALIQKMRVEISLLSSSGEIWRSPTCAALPSEAEDLSAAVSFPLYQRSEKDTCSCCIQAALGELSNPLWLLNAAQERVEQIYDPQLLTNFGFLYTTEKRLSDYMSGLQKAVHCLGGMPEALLSEIDNFLQVAESAQSHLKALKQSDTIKQKLREASRKILGQNFQDSDTNMLLVGSSNFEYLKHPNAKMAIESYSIFEDGDLIKVAYMPSYVYELLLEFNRRSSYYYQDIVALGAPPQEEVRDTAARLWTPHQKKSIFSDLKVALEAAQAL